MVRGMFIFTLRITICTCCMFMCFTKLVNTNKNQNWLQTKSVIIYNQKYNKINPGKGKIQKQGQRIINGEQVPISDYFYMASILKKGRHVCGGSIVSHLFILTAAHCVVTKKNQQVPNKDIIVSVGHKFWDAGDRYPIEFKVIHKQYKRENKLNDIALLRTIRTIQLGVTVRFVRLNPVAINDKDHNISATVLGWGYQDSETGHLVSKPAGYIFLVDLYVLPWQECKKYYGKRMSKTQLCVSSIDSRGSCNGDSGGPLMSKSDSGSEMQIGLVSFGGNCNNTTPEVYTRISSFYTWIRQMMKKHKLTM